MLEKFKLFIQPLKRISNSILMLILMLLVAYLILPETAIMGLISILISKAIYIFAGIIIAHVTRKLLFPYIDFETETDLTNNLMIIALYVTIIFCMSNGG